MKKTLICGLLIATYPLASLAAPLGWKGEAELGMVITDGNTETQNISAKMDLNDEQENWRHNIHAEALNASADDIRSAEKYTLSGKTSYKFNEFDSAFLVGTYDDDRFSGFDYQVSLAAGYGRRLINSDDQTLDVEIGPGYRINELDNGDSVDEGLVRVGAKYFLALSKTSNFQQSLFSEIGEEITITKSITSVKAQINGSLAMKASLTIKNTSEVPEGTEETDTETAVTLVYAF